MDELERFHALVGETIMECQCIEHDVKVMYAAMKPGDFKSNFKEVSESTLGQTLHYLEESDICSVNPYFSVNDYRLLDKVRDIRNYWAHRGYVNFVYKNDAEFEYAFSKEFEKLIRDNRMLKNLAAQTEKIRFEVVEKYAARKR